MAFKTYLVILALAFVSMTSARDLSSGVVKIATAENEEAVAPKAEFGNGAGASGGGGWMSDFAQEGCDCTCDCPDNDPDCSCVCDMCGDEVDQATMQKRRKQRRRRLAATGGAPPPNSLYY